MKRMLLLCPIYKPYSGGGGQYFPLLVSELARRKVFEKIFIVTEYHPDCPIYVKDAQASMLRILPRRDSLPEKKWIYHIASFFATYFLIFFILAFCVLFLRVNYLHITRYYRRFFTYVFNYLCRLMKCNFIADLRTTSSISGEFRCLKDFDFVLANSAAVYREASHYGCNSNLFFIPNPIFLPSIDVVNSYRLAPHIFARVADMRFILFCGQILARKSVFELIDAFIKVRERYPDINLLLVGRNMLGKKFLQYIENIRGVIYLDALERNSCLKLMLMSELVAVPSKIEGIPRVSIEALALGKKVLLPSCVPEFSSTGLFFCGPLDSNTLANQLEMILNSHSPVDYDVSVHDIDNSMKILLHTLKLESP